MAEQSSDLTPAQWRERLKELQTELHKAMRKLIDEKNYSEAEVLLRIVDKLLLNLIEAARGSVYRPDS
jgi:hypothetical protein